MSTLTGWLTIFNLIILVAGAGGGIWAFRSALSRAENDVQARVRDALAAENGLLQARVARLEKDNKRLENLMQLLIALLKKTHHIEVEIDGDIVTLRSSNGTHSGRISNAP
jgi:hypothetical protein